MIGAVLWIGLIGSIILVIVAPIYEAIRDFFATRKSERKVQEAMRRHHRAQEQIAEYEARGERAPRELWDEEQKSCLSYSMSMDKCPDREYREVMKGKYPLNAPVHYREEVGYAARRYYDEIDWYNNPALAPYRHSCELPDLWEKIAWERWMYEIALKGCPYEEVKCEMLEKYPLLPPPDGDPDEGWKRIETQVVKEEEGL